MKVIIPASGTGERFKKANYEKTKPLINVTASKKIIDYVFDVFDTKNDEFFIISSPSAYDEMEEHLAQTNINYKHILYTGEKLGPVGALYYSRNQLSRYIDEGDSVIVSYCDYGMIWDYTSFLEYIIDHDPDGCIVCYTGFHPHLKNPDNVYAACKVFDMSNNIYAVKEKYNSNNRYSELWSAGLYYFKDFDEMNSTFEKCIQCKDSLNGEYYVSLAYNYMKKNSNITAYDKVKKFYQFGTPKDFEYAKKKLEMSENFQNEKTRIDNIVVLSAGRGERFLNLNFNQPKPFLPLGNSYLANNIKKTFDDNTDKIVFVGAYDHQLFWNDSNLNVKLIQPNNIGAAYSYMEGCKHIEEEVLIVPCDLVAKHITPLFNELKKTADAIIFTADPTEYSNNNEDSFAWVSGNNNIITNISIKEKQKNVEEQMILIGSFWVRKNSLLLENIEEIFHNKIMTNGEYYLDNAFKNMLSKKLKIYYLKLNKYFSFGTPDEYNDSKYWMDDNFND